MQKMQVKMPELGMSIEADFSNKRIPKKLVANDAVQKWATVPIFELRVFAEQKRRQGFLPLTSLSACGK